MDMASFHVLLCLHACKSSRDLARVPLPLQVYVPIADLLWRDVTVRGFWLNVVSTYLRTRFLSAGDCAHV